MYSEKVLLNQTRIRETYCFLGFVYSDESFVWTGVFNFFPRKIKVKETKYKIRYSWFCEWELEYYWNEYEYRWEFKEIVK